MSSRVGLAAFAIASAGLALFVAGGPGCSAILGADFDVSLAPDAGAGGGAPVALVEVPFPMGIAIDARYVYFTTEGPSDGMSSDGTIARVPIAGGQMEVIADDRRGADQIAVDQDPNGYVYWSETRADGGVFRAPKMGGMTQAVALHQSMPIGVLLTNDRVYWATDEAVVGEPLSMIGSANAGPSITVATFASGDRPSFVVTDGEYFYVTLFGPGLVERVDGDGNMLSLDTPAHKYANALALRGENLVFTTLDDPGGVYMVKKKPDEGGVTIAPTEHTPGVVALDDLRAYWTEFGSGDIRYDYQGGGTVTTLASDQKSPDGIAVDDTYVYWTNDDADGSVMRARKP